MVPSMKRRLLIIVSVIIVGLVYLSFFRHNSKSKKLNVRIEFVQKFGEMDESEKNLIGLVTAFSVDRFENVLVTDGVFKNVKMFSKDGNVLKTYGHGEGSGPGEFRAPNGVDTDPHGNIYVIDKSLKNLTVFDSLNNVVKTLRTPFLPAQLVVTEPFEIYLSGFPFTYRGDLIYKYSLKQNTDDPSFTFCQRFSGKDSIMIARSGNSGRLVKSSGGNLYYSFFYPYEIRNFSSEGKLLKTIQREVNFFSPPYYASNGITSNAGIQELIVLPNELIVAIIYKRVGEEFVYYIDFFDDSTGEFLGSIPAKELGLDQIRFVKADNYGNIYLDALEPYPHINKYRIHVDRGV